jgi:hypothetical protein
MFWKKAHAKPFYKKPKIDHNFKFSFLRFFWFVVFLYVSQRRDKNTTRSFLQKKTAQKNGLFLVFDLSRFWAFLGERSSKTPNGGRPSSHRKATPECPPPPAGGASSGRGAVPGRT